MQRLEAMPPVGIYVAATALEQQFAAGEVKPKLHRQGIALFRGSAGGDAVRVFAQADATAMMVNRNNPAHDENPFA
ncbi:hypothetical protein [Paenirhodobacter populi]|uniref:hypothetical protein n=1 Tax=Paenirhodobacter populi TaxID=2306993 RepID=UPI0019D49845|nr:hypothetical protein [Sinirhodobacter populi]